MSLYLDKGKCATATMTAAHSAVSGLTTRTGNLGHILYADSFFSLLIYLIIYIMKAINCCGTVRPN
jgi:hypothetical protein